ncbi:MAG: hypothetical protein GY799_26885 [Desulfobulbaceae bacterium]|nr:hypothetical protein [Desulfobulbaceae bacterium]
MWPSAVYSATIEQRVWQEQQYSATIEQQIYGTLTGIWSPVVVVDGVDISTSVTGEISVTSTEGGATIASVTFIPADGSVDLQDWIGVPVTVDYQDTGWQVRKFTGICSSPQYFPRTKTITLSCTSDLQGSLESKERAEIDAIIPTGVWSKDVFDDDADGWQYAQDLASTTPGSLWTDKNGAVLFTDWAAKATPDITLTEADIINNDISIKHASKRDMVKRILMDIDYQFFNLRTRQHACAFKYTGTFCDFLQNPFKFPTKEMVRSAAESTGWQLDSMNYTELPETRFFDCWTGTGASKYKHGFLISTASLASCMGATFKMSNRWAQRVRENYVVDVRCEDDLDIANQYAVRESWNVTSDYDTSEWENQEPKHVGLSKGEENDIPSGGALHPGGSGDYSEEADTERRVEMEQAQSAIFAKAATEILGTHRKTEVSFNVLMQADIDLSKTIKIITPEVTAQGKIARTKESLSVKDGKATTNITLAISRKVGVGIGSSGDLIPVDRPDATEESPYKKQVWLGFRIGGVYNSYGGTIGGGSQAAQNDDDFNGFSTNYQNADQQDATLTFYSERMTVIIPEIEQAAVDATNLIAEQVIDVAVPDDIFTLTK